jgi:hypothetical protein
MEKSVRQGPRWLALAGLISALACFGAPVALAEGHQADSDDYNCNHGAPDDPTTIEACNRLRGTSQGAGADVGHQYNSDDYNCNHGAANDPTTLAACQHLRGTTEGVGRDEGHQRNSDDWNCHHGAPGEPATVVACNRLRGEYAVAEVRGRYATGHLVRDLPGARMIGGRAYRSVRFTVEFNCAAGSRRRVAVAYYAGRGATGARVVGGRLAGPWRAVPLSALPTACR